MIEILLMNFNVYMTRMRGLFGGKEHIPSWTMRTPK